MIAKDCVGTDPLDSGASTGVLALTGAGIDGGGVLTVSVNSLTTCNRNPPS